MDTSTRNLQLSFNIMQAREGSVNGGSRTPLIYLQILQNAHTVWYNLYAQFT